jgi:hypothetical protein
MRKRASTRGAAVLTLFLMGVLVIAGLATDRGAFLSNVVAELVGIALGVLVALFLVDRVAAARKRDRWLRVRQQTLDAIFAHITDLTRKCLLHTPVGDQVEPHWVASWLSLGGERPTAAATGVLRSLAAGLRDRADEMSAAQVPGVANSRVALDEVAPHVAQVRDMLVPRLIDFDGVPELVERLLAMTDAEREWSLQVAFSEKGHLQEIWVGWVRGGRFFEACADVVAYLEALYPSAAGRGAEELEARDPVEAGRSS